MGCSGSKAEDSHRGGGREGNRKSKRKKSKRGGDGDTEIDPDNFLGLVDGLDASADASRSVKTAGASMKKGKKKKGKLGQSKLQGDKGSPSNAALTGGSVAHSPKAATAGNSGHPSASASADHPQGTPKKSSTPNAPTNPLTTAAAPHNNSSSNTSAKETTPLAAAQGATTHQGKGTDEAASPPPTSSTKDVLLKIAKQQEEQQQVEKELERKLQASQASTAASMTASEQSLENKKNMTTDQRSALQRVRDRESKLDVSPVSVSIASNTPIKPPPKRPKKSTAGRDNKINTVASVKSSISSPASVVRSHQSITSDEAEAKRVMSPHNDDRVGEAESSDAFALENQRIRSAECPKIEHLLSQATTQQRVDWIHAASGFEAAEFSKKRPQIVKWFDQLGATVEELRVAELALLNTLATLTGGVGTSGVMTSLVLGGDKEPSALTLRNLRQNEKLVLQIEARCRPANNRKQQRKRGASMIRNDSNLMDADTSNLMDPNALNEALLASRSGGSSFHSMMSDAKSSQNSSDSRSQLEEDIDDAGSSVSDLYELENQRVHQEKRKNSVRPPEKTYCGRR